MPSYHSASFGGLHGLDKHVLSMITHTSLFFLLSFSCWSLTSFPLLNPFVSAPCLLRLLQLALSTLTEWLGYYTPDVLVPELAGCSLSAWWVGCCSSEATPDPVNYSMSAVHSHCSQLCHLWTHGFLRSFTEFLIVASWSSIMHVLPGSRCPNMQTWHGRTRHDRWCL